MNLVLFWADEYSRLLNDGILAVPLSDDRGRHMKDVLKLKEGDSVRVGIAGEPIYEQMAVVGFDGSCIRLSATGRKFRSAPLFDVTLIVGQVRPICMKRILRDVASLGVGKVILTLGQSCERSYAQAGIYKSGEYLRFLLNGGMQAGSSLLPEVLFAASAREAMEQAGRCPQRMLLDNEIGSSRLSEARLSDVPTAIAIGPERGWTSDERTSFLSCGYLPMTIGERILRTETAVPAGVALLLCRLGKI